MLRRIALLTAAALAARTLIHYLERREVRRAREDYVVGVRAEDVET